MKALQTRIMEATATVAVLGAAFAPQAGATVNDVAASQARGGVQQTRVDLRAPDALDAATLAHQGYVISPGVGAPTSSLTSGGNGWTDAGIGGAGFVVLAGGLVLAIRMHQRPAHRPVLQ
jgi:hypothetical protein